MPERRVIDFSASVNPLGISARIKAELRQYLKTLNNYPDPDCRRLIRHISSHLSIPEENITCGNGSTELIYLLARALNPEMVLIPAPTFSEYERAVSNAGASIRFLKLKEDDGFSISASDFIDQMGNCRMAFLCNPNNPTARMLSSDSILRIAEAARERDCFLVIDEAFIDFVPEESVVRNVLQNPYLIVLRSMTKFYALSGLRLGFSVTSGEVASRLQSYKEPWTVNTLAQRAGVAAIRDNHYRKLSFEMIEKEKALIEEELGKLGIFFFPSMVNFYLLRDERAEQILSRLRKRDILLRDCSNFKGLDSRFIRIAVKGHRENRALIKELKRFL